MAKEKNSFVLYYDLEDILFDLSDSQIAELFRAIFAYEKRGEAYSGSDPEVKIAMRFVSRALDDNDERYRAKVEKRREAGRKGGLKSAQSRKQKKQNEAKQANATKGKQKKQSQANQADNEPEPVPDNDTDSEGTTSPTRARNAAKQACITESPMGGQRDHDQRRTPEAARRSWPRRHSTDDRAPEPLQSGEWEAL